MTAHVQSSGARFLNPWRITGWGLAAALLTVPLLADFPWTTVQFIRIGAVFAVVGGLVELAVRHANSPAHAGGAGIAIVTCLVLLWIGVVGSDEVPSNRVYFVEFAIAVAGAIVAKFQAEAMARAMFVTAGFQLLITSMLVIEGWGPDDGAIGRLWVNCLLIAPWLLAGWLFRRAAQVAG